MSTSKSKRVAIIGLSAEGQDSITFFCNEKAQVTACDQRTKEQLGEIYTQLKKYPISFSLGDDYLKSIDDYDLVVRTSGMYLHKPELAKARSDGRVTSQIKLFFDLCPAPIIGVTGTKGKGTTSTLIYTMLKESGKTVWLGGNIGTPLLSQVRKIRSSDIVVLELSSFQLEDLTKSPHVAVVLRITQDHLANYDRLATNYHPTVEAYREAKRSIVKYQTDQDIAILHADDPVSSFYAQATPAKIYFFSGGKNSAHAYLKDQSVFLRLHNQPLRVCDASSILLRGKHNLENIAAASLAAILSGGDIETIKSVAKSFKGLEHRLEYVRRVMDVDYYDDSFSTVPETAIAAIKSFDRPIILIVGGSEKGSDFTQLGKEITVSSVKTVIVIGDMSERIVESLQKAGYSGKIITGCQSMHEVVQLAFKESKAGEIVLLSPACASFDMFKNYKDRGNQFKYEVSIL